MSLNPILAQDSTSISAELFPLPYPNETFLLKREGVAFSLKFNYKTFSGSGRAFLTSRRIVLLRSGNIASHKEFTSVELPLTLIRGSEGAHSHPSFHQPIFGANYLSGKVDPLVSAAKPLPATADWTITFTKGGCQTFVENFYMAFDAATRLTTSSSNTANTQSFPNSEFVPSQAAALYDPSDPSVLYITQPVPTPIQPPAS